MNMWSCSGFILEEVNFLFHYLSVHFKQTFPPVFYQLVEQKVQNEDNDESLLTVAKLNLKIKFYTEADHQPAYLASCFYEWPVLDISVSSLCLHCLFLPM